MKKHQEQIDRITSYYNKRLILEMEENKKFQETTFKKMIIYRDRLIEHGLYNFDD